MTPLRLIEADDSAAAAAEMIAATLRAATGGGRRAAIAISGGETPWLALARLRADDCDWRLVDVFQVDERIVPRDHSARNFAGLDRTLLSRVPAVAHPMPVEAYDLAAAAAAYAASLPAAFDLIQLGLGTDGHTASLVPGDPVLSATADVAITALYQGHRRMTLTFPVLNRARRIVWLVNGKAKSDALTALMAGSGDIPANGVARDTAWVIADAAALGTAAGPAR